MLRNVCAYLGLALVTAAPGAAVAAADWHQFGGPNRNSVASDKTKLARRWPRGGPKEVWRLSIGPGFGGPSIRDGRVYLLDRVADKRDVLRCLDLRSGRELWTYPYDVSGKLEYDGSRSTPTVDKRHVYTIGPFGQFHCVSLSTHKPLWTKNLIAEFAGKRPDWGFSRAPLLYRDWVIVMPSSGKAGVVAYDRATGNNAWQSPPLGKPTYSSPLPVTIDGKQQIVVVSGTDRISGVGPRTGKVLWSYRGWECAYPIATPLSIGDGRFFITGGYGAGSAMFEIRRRSATFRTSERFKTKVPGSIIHNALLYQGHLYIKHNNKQKHRGIMCLDLDGKVKWARGKGSSYDFGHMLLADGLIFNLDGKTGELRLIRPTPQKYSLLASAPVFPGKQEIWAPMAISGGMLVLRDQKTLKCLDVR